MPKSDTWPGGVAMEPSSNLDSAGSCDSVISVNSGHSQDSMEHLSPEERACLMFFEETIEALEVQEDSGISNDEPDPVFPAGPGVNGVPSFTSNAHKEDPGTKVSSTKDQAEHHLVMVARAGAPHGVSREAPEVDVGVIPPPSDFMDQPGSPPSARIPDEQPGAPVEPTQSTHVPPNEPPKRSLPPLSPRLLKSPPPEAAEPRSPPAVAPKPKKLPTNIILKSHKASVDRSEHLVQSSSDWHMPDPQRVRIEALIKLGLLPAEAEPGAAAGHIHSPRSRSSWAPPLSPISPRPPHTPPYTFASSPSPARGPPRAPAAAPPSAASAAPAEPVPAPHAFIDPVGPPPSGNELRADGGAPEATVNARMSTPHRASPAPVKLQTPPKGARPKSATLERCGLGLSGYAAAEDAAGQPHRNRRQASLGGLKEFASAGREASASGRTDGREHDPRRSPPAHSGLQHAGGASPKLPRSQGVSVLICPRAENEGGRRQALKKLGLLRD